MSTIRVSRAALEQVEARWPGFLPEIEAHGTWEGAVLVVPAAAYAAVWADHHTGASQPAGAVTAGTKAGRGVKALWRWARGGFGFVERRARKQRQAACEACEAWSPRGNLGLGECRDPRCGCTRAKKWLPTETCPRGKWPVKPPSRAG